MQKMYSSMGDKVENIKLAKGGPVPAPAAKPAGKVMQKAMGGPIGNMKAKPAGKVMQKADGGGVPSSMGAMAEKKGGKIKAKC